MGALRLIEGFVKRIDTAWLCEKREIAACSYRIEGIFLFPAKGSEDTHLAVIFIAYGVTSLEIHRDIRARGLGPGGNDGRDLFHCVVNLIGLS